jgi:hypothetical protein
MVSRSIVPGPTEGKRYGFRREKGGMSECVAVIGSADVSNIIHSALAGRKL